MNVANLLSLRKLSSAPTAVKHDLQHLIRITRAFDHCYAPPNEYVLQRLVRSVLCTRIVIPAADKVSNRVIRAVLSGDREALDEAVKRKRLKGVAVALAADDRY